MVVPKIHGSWMVSYGCYFWAYGGYKQYHMSGRVEFHAIMIYFIQKKYIKNIYKENLER